MLSAFTYRGAKTQKRILTSTLHTASEPYLRDSAAPRGTLSHNVAKTQNLIQT